MRILLCAACALLLAACSSTSSTETTEAATQSSGIWPFGSSDSAAPNRPELGVNGYLWRATLDTLNFMPLASADPVGGVVITEWYSAPEAPSEQMKVTAYILDRRLRADALKITVFRQIRGASGWIDAPVNTQTATKLEDAVLSRARELRLASVGSDQ